MITINVSYDNKVAKNYVPFSKRIIGKPEKCDQKVEKVGRRLPGLGLYSSLARILMRGLMSWLA